MNNNTKACIIVGAIVLVIVVGIASCGDDSDYDVGRDEDGFLGYSDSYWEWVVDNT